MTQSYKRMTVRIVIIFYDNNNDDNHVNDAENDDDVSEEAESFSEHLCDDTAANDGTSEPESLAVLGLKYWP